MYLIQALNQSQEVINQEVEIMLKMAWNWTKVQLSILKNQDGQGMVEYALIIAFIAIVVIAGLVFLGPVIRDMFLEIGGELETTTAAPVTTQAP